MPPVVLVIFNRPDLVERQAESLHKLPLQQLFVIGDGPREQMMLKSAGTLALQWSLSIGPAMCRLIMQKGIWVVPNELSVASTGYFPV